MKIAYLGQMADVSGENGISKKIGAQSRTWMNAGHEVRYFSLVPSTLVWSGLRSVPMELVARGRGGARLWRSWKLAARIRAWEPDVIYFRYAYHSPGLPRLFRTIPVVAEINSADTTEYGLTLSRTKVVYHRLTRARILRPVRGFVTVTRELATRFAHFGRPVVTIGNSIELTVFDPLPAPAADPPSLVFVGSAGTPWHGIERVLELAALLPDVRIDIVGLSPTELRDPPGFGPAVPPPNVVWHGPLPRGGYWPLLQRATAALGTLALYRKQMQEACPLKVREYLACGLPVIGAYTDTDVPSGSDYFLELPNAAIPLAPHLDAVRRFLRHWEGQRVRRDAVRHLDTSVKEMQRLEFIRAVAGSAADRLA